MYIGLCALAVRVPLLYNTDFPHSEDTLSDSGLCAWIFNQLDAYCVH